MREALPLCAVERRLQLFSPLRSRLLSSSAFTISVLCLVAISRLTSPRIPSFLTTLGTQLDFVVEASVVETLVKVLAANTKAQARGQAHRVPKGRVCLIMHARKKSSTTEALCLTPFFAALPPLQREVQNSAMLLMKDIVSQSTIAGNQAQLCALAALLAPLTRAIALGQPCRRSSAKPAFFCERAAAPLTHLLLACHHSPAPQCRCTSSVLRSRTTSTLCKPAGSALARRARRSLSD